jgi:GAF domain
MAGISERYERLLEAGLVLAADLSLPATLQRIVELAADVTGARYGALGVLGRDGRITDFITTGVTEAERAAAGPIPHGRGILGVLISDARPLRLHDIAEDPRSVGLPPGHPPMRTFLGVPVMARGRVYGNLYLTEKHGGQDFDDDDERALVLLAGQAGAAIEAAQLFEEANDRAQRLEAVRAITTAILAGTDTGELLGLIVGQARALVGADLATLALPSDDERLGTVFPAEGSVTGDVIRTPGPPAPARGCATCGNGPSAWAAGPRSPASPARGRASGSPSPADGPGSRATVPRRPARPSTLGAWTSP